MKEYQNGRGVPVHGKPLRQLEVSFLEKDAWGDGPWRTEPDSIQWVDPTTNLDCFMARMPFTGVWCGYVGVPRKHALFGVKYVHVDVEIHGGLTFSERIDSGASRGEVLVYEPLPGRSSVLWWFGFDCGHAFDLSPMFQKFMPQLFCVSEFSVTYRDRAYVQHEIERLAIQLQALQHISVLLPARGMTE